MHGFAPAIHRHGHRHVPHLEFVDGLHAQFREGQQGGAGDCLGHQIGGAAHGDQRHRLVVADGGDGLRPPLRLADHAHEAGALQQDAREAIHAGGGGRPGWADHFVAHRIYRADVVDEAIPKIHGQRFAGFQQVENLLVRGVPPGQHAAGEQQGLAGPPTVHFLAGEAVQVDPAHRAVQLKIQIRPVIQVRRLKLRRAAAIQGEAQMAGGRAVGDHRHRLVGRVGGVFPHLQIQHRGQPPQALGADAQGIDLLEQFQTQLLRPIGWPPGLQIMDVDGFHHGFLGHQHGLFRGAADADAQNARRTPAGAHGRHRGKNPIRHGIVRVQHREHGLGLAAAALGRHLQGQPVARNQTAVDHRRAVVPGIDPSAVRVRQHRAAQQVVRMQVAPANALVDHLLQAHLRIPAHFHAHFQEDIDNARVLADGTLAQSAHARVDQHLAQGRLGRRRFLLAVGFGHGADEIRRVVVGDVLQGIGDALNQMFLLNDGHGRCVSWRDNP